MIGDVQIKRKVNDHKAENEDVDDHQQRSEVKLSKLRIFFELRDSQRYNGGNREKENKA